MIEKRLKIIVFLCISMVAVHVVNIVLNNQLNYFGISPGNLHTLPFIYTAPWLHGSWGHLFNNLFGMAVFSALCLIRGPAFFVKSSLLIITLTGVLVWLLGRSGSYHIGASGWIFGLWSLSIAIAWFERSFVSIAIAVFVAVFYGGMIWGVLPTRPGVSFESHLFGAVAGIVTAYVMTRPGQRKLRKR